MGTRPYHSTYGGLMEIQSTMARRFAIMMNIDQCNTMKQMDEMYWLFEQFMFEALPFQKYDAGIGAVSYKREDIDTDGEGFLYVAGDDPSFGDSQVQRNQALVLLTQSMAFGDYALRHPEEDKCKVSEIFRFVLETFGKGESTKILVPADGSVDPDKEFELMLQGVPVQTQPKENKSWHIIKHTLQLQGLNNNQDKNPQIAAALINHLDQTRADMAEVLDNPEQFAGQFAQDEALKKMGSGGGPAAPNLGQNLPAVNGAPPVPQEAMNG
jgi:hypothetical protein